jgi:hypothetical protein
VARRIFQACPVWIYTQSNITQAYLYEFVANESSFGIYTPKTKEILFEI